MNKFNACCWRKVPLTSKRDETISMETALKNARDSTRKTASGGDIQRFPALLKRIDERQDIQHGPRATDCGRQQCKFRDAECFLCHKKGHISRKCRRRPF